MTEMSNFRCYSTPPALAVCFVSLCLELQNKTEFSCQLFVTKLIISSVLLAGFYGVVSGFVSNVLDVAG